MPLQLSMVSILNCENNHVVNKFLPSYLSS